MLTRILPLQFRAKASAEGPCGNRALHSLTTFLFDANKEPAFPND